MYLIMLHQILLDFSSSVFALDVEMKLEIQKRF